jgi:hypothetical protein
VQILPGSAYGVRKRNGGVTAELVHDAFAGAIPRSEKFGRRCGGGALTAEDQDKPAATSRTAVMQLGPRLPATAARMAALI